MEGSPNIRLRRARLGKMWPMNLAARNIGVDERTYMRWEQGRQRPQLSTLKNLCEVFGMTAEELGFGYLVRVKEEPNASQILEGYELDEIAIEILKATDHGRNIPGVRKNEDVRSLSDESKQ